MRHTSQPLSLSTIRSNVIAKRKYFTGDRIFGKIRSTKWRYIFPFDFNFILLILYEKMYTSSPIWMDFGICKLGIYVHKNGVELLQLSYYFFVHWSFIQLSKTSQGPMTNPYGSIIFKYFKSLMLLIDPLCIVPRCNISSHPGYNLSSGLPGDFADATLSIARWKLQAGEQSSKYCGCDFGCCGCESRG